jgi:drug/metabolite transporter (DMT)-like permease
MTLATLALTLATVLAIAGGQMLFKLGALASNTAGADVSLLVRYANAYLITAIVVYAVATALWVYVLKSVPLNIAYPFMGLAFVIVPLLGAVFLGEPVAARHLIGGAVIAAGIGIVQSA